MTTELDPDTAALALTPAHQQTEAYAAALAFHLRVGELTPGRGCRLYREQLERVTFRILMLLDEAAAWTGNSKARNALPAIMACCNKVSSCLKTLRGGGYLESDLYLEAVTQLAAVQKKLSAQLTAAGGLPAVKSAPTDAAANARPATTAHRVRPSARMVGVNHSSAPSRIEGLVKNAAAAQRARRETDQPPRVNGRPGGSRRAA